MVMFPDPINILPDGQNIFGGIFFGEFIFAQCFDYPVKIQKAYMVDERPCFQLTVCAFIGGADLN